MYVVGKEGMMVDEDTRAKIIEGFLTDETTPTEQAKRLHIGRKTYERVVAEEVELRPFHNREQAWDLYKDVSESTVLFYRLAGLSRLGGQAEIINTVLSNEQIEEKVSQGVPMTEILSEINMPTINLNILYRYTEKLGIAYKKEDIVKNRVTAITNKWKSDIEWGNKVKQTLAKVNAERNARRPKKPPKIKFKKPNGEIDREAVQRGVAKAKKTNMERYGVDHPLKRKDFMDKLKNTNLERYGVENVFQSEKIKEKTKKTLQDRYNVEYISQSPSIQSRIKKTSFAKYGYDHVMKSPEVKDKVTKTNYERYGYSNYNIVNRYFKPTEYVSSKEESVQITKTADSLKRFLRELFPTKDKFTLWEITYITGCRYGYIASKFSTSLDFIEPSKQGHLPEAMQRFLESLGFVKGVDFLVNDRNIITPQEIDFYFPKQKVGIEVNDLTTHNHTHNPYTNDSPKSKNYHMEKSKLAKEKGIRLIHAWEQYFDNPQQYEVLKNAIKHALGISKYRVYARNTYVKEVPNITLKEFFNKNNIQGFRGAKTAYALFDKKTDEVLMAYSVGNPHFSRQKYDLEIIRGASRLDTTIVGGASKLWKYIIKNNPDVNYIVYCIDRDLYDGSSIGMLAGSLKLVSTEVELWNYFIDTKDMKTNQQKQYKELVEQGKVWEVYNAGTETYVWTRS